MPTRSIMVHLPESLYRRLERRAEQVQRTVEDELLDVVAAAVAAEDEVEASSSLALLDDQALWRAARMRLPGDVVEELECLHLKRQGQGLTASETQRAEALLRHYERLMQVRAEAAALLKQRGHDVSVLLIDV